MIKTLPSSWNLTGCELYAGKQYHPAGMRFWAHNRNWNLLLVESGKLRILIRNRSYTFEAGDLILLESKFPREFIIIEQLTVHWIHFDLDAHLQYSPEWPSPRKGVYLLHPKADSGNEFVRLFSEIYKLCEQRQRGWYRLGYCMIQEILLRGNMLNERGMEPDDIIFAARILRNVSVSVSIEQLIEQSGMSRAVFYRRFRESFGVSPSQYREQRKLNCVRELLESSTKSLKEIAEICDFANAFYCSSRFHKMFGISPREYRRNYLDSISRNR